MRRKTESEIEQAHRKRAIKVGWLVRKIQFIGRRSAPDRFYARKGRVVLLEWKREDGALRRHQELEHKLLRAAGVEVYVIRNHAEAEAILGIAGDDDVLG